MVGQRLFLPFLASNTPSPTATATLTPTRIPPTQDPGAVWAPSGRQYATKTGAVVNLDTGQVASDLINPDSLTVYGWTTDSRYVVFASKNAFNSTHTYVFDTQQWKLVFSTTGCLAKETGALSDICGDFPVAMASSRPYVLLENSSLVNFSTQQMVSLDAQPGGVSILVVSASWAPDDSNLVWISREDKTKLCSANLATGAGENPRLAGLLDGCPLSLDWLGTTAVQITTSTTRYLLDVSSARLDIVNAATASPAGVPTITATTGP